MKELRFHGQAIVTGRGSLSYLKTIDAKRVFIVTGGSSMFKNGAIEKAKTFLAEAGCAVEVFSGVQKNPSLKIVLEGIEKMRQFKPDLVIGLGGGSALDASKVMTLFYDSGLDVAEAYKKASVPQIRKTKMIAIPSTSGTASEITCFAVLTFEEDNLKIGAKSAAYVPDVSILDAELTVSMPANVAAETGMDALCHAVECYTNKSLDDFTEVLAAGAVEGIFKYLPLSYSQGTIDAREKMHNYQAMAGCAFANVGTGLDHGIAHAMGGRYNFGHGLVIAVALPYVLKYNSQDTEVNAKLSYLAKRIGKPDFVLAVRDLNLALHIPKSFKELGISEAQFKADFKMLVENSLKGSTRTNPVPVSSADMEKILTDIYEGRPIE